MTSRRGRLSLGEVSLEQVETYLQTHGYPNARVSGFSRLGEGTQNERKTFGYGRPILITFENQQHTQRIVLRTVTSNIFGHARRSERIASLILSFDTFGAIPRHVRPLDVGAFNAAGELVSFPAGEPFLLTEFAEGRLYADDLSALAHEKQASEESLARARALSEYLCHLHRQPRPVESYRSAFRDTLCSGEGLLGILDSYEASDPVATPARLQRLEQATLAWRGRLRAFEHRCRVIHGDFHPFNILYRGGLDFTVLDCSRGAVGDPADDVTCLTVNYIFFALTTVGSFAGAMRDLWDTFWENYLHKSADKDLCHVVAPFYAWRVAVLASPIWYPGTPPEIRNTLLAFAERLVQGACFEPLKVGDMLT